MTRFKILTFACVCILYMSSHFFTCANNTATGGRVKRIAYGQLQDTGKFAFVAAGLGTWCEKFEGKENCSLTTNVFTATILSHGYMVTSFTILPCLLRKQIMYPSIPQDKHTYSNLKYEFRFGTRGFKDQFTQQIVATYPKDIDFFLEYTDKEFKTKPSDLCYTSTSVVLVYLNTFIEFNELVRPISILRMPIRSTVDKNCVAVSYNNHFDKSFDGQLQSAGATFGNMDYCKRLDHLFYPVKPYLVCSKAKDYLREACNRDQGTPLVCGTENTFYYLVGILWSTADPYTEKVECGKSDTHYARYVYLGYFENWFSSSKTNIQFTNLPGVKSSGVARADERGERARAQGTENKDSSSNVTSIAAARQNHSDSVMTLVLFSFYIYLSLIITLK